MDDKILIAIISTGSALIGSLIPTLFAYLKTNKQNQFDLKKDLLKDQKVVYEQILNALQNIINNGGNDEFIALQKALNKLAIYGDNNSSLAMNEYYYRLTKQEQNGMLTSKDHEYFQQRIINGIRQNLGLAKFNSFSLIGYRPGSNLDVASIKDENYFPDLVAQITIKQATKESKTEEN